MGQGPSPTGPIIDRSERRRARWRRKASGSLIGVETLDLQRAILVVEMKHSLALNSRSVRPIHQSFLRLNDFALDLKLARILKPKRQQLTIVDQRQIANLTMQYDCNRH